MNIYFCDVCGVRVTDTDLQSGHGMRRRNDVVCAACLELGHGKGLLSQSDARAQLVGAGVAAAPAAANGHAANGHALAGPTPGVQADPLLARDRVRTLDDDVPPSPVEPVSVAAETADKAAEAPLEDTAKVPVVHQELSAVAAGFAALNAAGTQEKSAADEDVEEVPPNKLDDSGGVAALAPAPEADADPEKAETTSSLQVEAAPGEGTKARSERTARRATSSSRVTKQAKGRSARRGRSGSNSQMLYVFSGMATVVVILFGIILYNHLSENEHGKSRTTVGENISQELRTAVGDARSAIRAANESPDDHNKASQALVQIDRVHKLEMEYGRVATEQHISDDDQANEMERLGANDVMGQRKAMEDLFAKSH